MKIVERYSHINGWEYLVAHRPHLWDEIESALAAVDAKSCRTLVTSDKTRPGSVLYTPRGINRQLKDAFNAHGWYASRMDFWIPDDYRMIPRIANMGTSEPERLLAESAAPGFRSHNEADFFKERVAVEVQFGLKECVAYDLFVKHVSLHLNNRIDVGIEILGMRALVRQMSAGIGSFEGEVYNILRQGRNIPPVPLIILGVDI